MTCESTLTCARQRNNRHFACGCRPARLSDRMRILSERDADSLPTRVLERCDTLSERPAVTTPSPQPEFAAISELGRKIGHGWPRIESAATEARTRREELSTRFEQKRLVPADTSVVVFGSLARGEWTAGSDVDWTLLVDGAADQEHLTVTHLIRKELEELKLNPPGRTAVFGGVTFSHELIHRIGGDADTNRNTTQRILLLLESSAVANRVVRDRVVRTLLNRYLTDDYGYHALEKFKIRVPRFLLNDIVRYWRTMAVDFAAKQRERDGAGWALRNIKLRMSRKLIFAAGLAMCLDCQLHPSAQLSAGAFASEADFYSALTEHLMGFADQPPLDLLASVTLKFGGGSAAGAEILDAYEQFLELLSDKDKRSHLEGLKREEAVGDDLFVGARSIAENFQRGLSRFFFATDAKLTDAAQRYGVF